MKQRKLSDAGKQYLSEIVKDHFKIHDGNAKAMRYLISEPKLNHVLVFIRLAQAAKLTENDADLLKAAGLFARGPSGYQLTGVAEDFVDQYLDLAKTRKKLWLWRESDFVGVDPQTNRVVSVHKKWSGAKYLAKLGGINEPIVMRASKYHDRMVAKEAANGRHPGRGSRHPRTRRGHA